MGKQWGVNAFPTLLFFNTEGDVIHRIVGAPDLKILLAEGKRAVERKGYAWMNEQYASGNRDACFHSVLYGGVVIGIREPESGKYLRGLFQNIG